MGNIVEILNRNIQYRSSSQWYQDHEIENAWEYNNYSIYQIWFQIKHMVINKGHICAYESRFNWFLYAR